MRRLDLLFDWLLAACCAFPVYSAVMCGRHAGGGAYKTVNWEQAAVVTMISHVDQRCKQAAVTAVPVQGCIGNALVVGGELPSLGIYMHVSHTLNETAQRWQRSPSISSLSLNFAVLTLARRAEEIRCWSTRSNALMATPLGA